MNRWRQAAAALAVTTVAASGTACDEKLSDLTGPTPNLTPTLTSITNDIFAAPDASGRVACTGCHTNVGRVPAMNLNLSPGAAYGSLVNRGSLGKPGAILVIPGDPNNSYLIQKLEGAPGIVGQRMPRTQGPFLTPGQIAVIRRWIELGAQNN